MGDTYPVGPLIREQAAKHLEQAFALVWAGILESHGHTLAEGWRLTLGELRLEREEVPPNGHPDGRDPATAARAHPAPAG